MTAQTIGTPLLWGGFLAFILSMVALDLLVFHRRTHAVRVREALGWSLFWIGLALAFNFLVYRWYGPEKGMEFLGGYLIEKALSVDNIFVFLVLFSYFGVPPAYQHRVLFWGILGALVMRGVFIAAGAAMIHAFHWVLYVFGAILLLTGVKMFFSGKEEVRPEKNPLFRIFKRFVPAVEEYREARFFVREAGRWAATPLLAVLVAVEASDIVFAVDSIPAVFAVSQDPFIVYTSNIFAILGLRALFFLLAGGVLRLRYLKAGLSVVLCFIGGKMLIGGFYKIPLGFSLGIVAALLALAVTASLLRPLPEPDVGD